MSWRGIEGGIAAARAGHDVVMAPGSHTYFDYYQSTDTTREPLAIGGFLPLDTGDAFEPVPPGLTAGESPPRLGGHGQVWDADIPGPKRGGDKAVPPAGGLCGVLLWP